MSKNEFEDFKIWKNHTWQHNALKIIRTKKTTKAYFFTSFNQRKSLGVLFSSNNIQKGCSRPMKLRQILNANLVA
jgi:hypothetical protein